MLVAKFMYGIFIMLQTGVSLATQMESPPVWRYYSDTRTGVSVQYPAALVADGPATDLTDGQPGGATRGPTGAAFSSNDGIEISIYGSNSGRSPYAEICLNGCDGESYSIKRAKFAVVSGSKANFIYYHRCQVAQGIFSLRCFSLQYPSAKRSIMDGVIERMTKTLR